MIQLSISVLNQKKLRAAYLAILVAFVLAGCPPGGPGNGEGMGEGAGEGQGEPVQDANDRFFVDAARGNDTNSGRRAVKLVTVPYFCLSN